MRDRKDLFHKMWEEEQQRIMTEQSIFKEQVHGYLDSTFNILVYYTKLEIYLNGNYF